MAKLAEACKLHSVSEEIKSSVVTDGLLYYTSLYVN